MADGSPIVSFENIRKMAQRHFVVYGPLHENPFPWNSDARLTYAAEFKRLQDGRVDARQGVAL